MRRVVKVNNCVDGTKVDSQWVITVHAEIDFEFMQTIRDLK